MNEHIKKILILSGLSLIAIIFLKGTSFDVSSMPKWAIVIAIIMATLLLVAIMLLIWVGFKSFKNEKGHGNVDDSHPEEGHADGHGDDHQHKVESKRAFIAKMFALVLTFITLVAIAIIFIRAYKEVSLDKDDTRVAKQAAEQAMMKVSNQVSFKIPAGSRGRTIQFKTENGFEYGQAYIYNPHDDLKVTIVTATGRRWDDGPDMPRGEAIGPDDWPITIISRQGEIPVFPFERAGKYNK